MSDGLGSKGVECMTDRNFKKELNYYVYNDPEYSEDIENIDYDCLIGIIAEFCDRIEKLEDKVDELNPNPRWSLD